jgi:hypothetical protein
VAVGDGVVDGERVAPRSVATGDHDRRGELHSTWPVPCRGDGHIERAQVARVLCSDERTRDRDTRSDRTPPGDLALCGRSNPGDERLYGRVLVG